MAPLEQLVANLQESLDGDVWETGEARGRHPTTELDQRSILVEALQRPDLELAIPALVVAEVTYFRSRASDQPKVAC